MEVIDFDLDTLTLGELSAAETASGQDASVLLTRTGHRRLLAVFVQRLRNSGVTPNWQELESLRVLDVQSSTSPSSPANLSPKSNN